MRIKSLKLENFKGTRNKTFVFDCQSANVYGTNAVGKTTIFNGYTWLVFGKIYDEKSGKGWVKDFDIRPTDEAGRPSHNIETLAEGVFDIDGKEVTLRRVYKERWRKQNGSADKEFDGNTTDYFINGVPTKEREYLEYVNAIAPTDKMQILSHPLEFALRLDWKERRNILFALCGEVSDADIFAANPDLAELAELTKDYGVDDLRTINVKKCGEINKELEILPSRINEAHTAIPDLTGLDLRRIESDIAELEKEKSELQAKRGGMSESESTSNLRAEIARLETELEEGRNKYTANLNAENKGVYAEIERLDGVIRKLKSDVAEADESSAKFRRDAVRIEKERAELEKKYAAIKAQNWVGETFCFVCDRDIPADKINASRDVFADDKAKRMTAIIADVKANCSKGMQADAAERAEYFAVVKEHAEKDLAKSKAERDGLKPLLNNFALTDFCKETTTRIAELKSTLADGQNVSEAAQIGIDRQIQGINVKIAALNENKAKFATKERQEARIDELSKRQKELGAQFGEAQRILNLCNEFIRAKSDMVNRNAGAKFKTVSFRLFENQVNGGLKEVCDMLIPTRDGTLVAFDGANDADKINAGIEIIEALSEYWDVELPLFVDRRESVVKLLECGLQIVSLIVSGADVELRIDNIGERWYNNVA